jgi:hypothetical protein
MNNGLPSLILRVLGYRCLNERESKYLIWRFGFNMSERQIAIMDERAITQQAVSFIIRGACRKIKLSSRNI